MRLVLKTPLQGMSNPWRQVIVRPVLLKSRRHLQFSYFNQKQDITKNYRGPEAEARLDEVLALPFASIAVQSTTGERLFQITKRAGRFSTKASPSPNIFPTWRMMPASLWPCRQDGPMLFCGQPA